MRTTQPPGARSTRYIDGPRGSGGEWKVCRATSERKHFFADLRLINDQLGESERETLLEELRHAMKLGEQGELPYGERAPHLVCVTARQEDVLELRVAAFSGATLRDSTGPEEVLLRMYYAEPKSYHRALWLASITLKRPDTTDWRAIQDADIDEAHTRLEAFDVYCLQTGVTP